MSASTRYHQQERIAEGGEVETFRGRDPLNGLPVRIYRFAGEPTAQPGELRSSHIPALLSSSLDSGSGQVVTVFSHSYRPVEAPVPAHEVEALLRQTAAALDAAAEAGVVHGDLCPERLFYIEERRQGGRTDEGRAAGDSEKRGEAKGEATRRYLLEGYGAPWGVRASEYNAPERIEGASYAGDVFSWAMSVRTLAGALPGGLRDLLSSCLDADPGSRPHAREVCAALASYSRRDGAPDTLNDTSNVETDEPAETAEVEDAQAQDAQDQESQPRAGDLPPADVPRRAEHLAQAAPVAVYTSDDPEKADPEKTPDADTSTASEDGTAGDELTGDELDVAAPNAGDPESSVADKTTRVHVYPDMLERFAGAQFNTEDEDDSFDDLQGTFSPATANPSSPDKPPRPPAAAPVRVIQGGAQAEQSTGQTVPTAQAKGSELPLSADALRRLDATPEYETRREQFKAQQRGVAAPPNDSAENARARLQKNLGGASATGRAPSTPEPTTERQTDLPKVQTAPGRRPSHTPNVEPSPRPNLRVRTFRADDDDLGDDFDDIDDRGPDPTAVRGGLRVLLLSLLVVAVLVLLALLLFNP